MQPHPISVAVDCKKKELREQRGLSQEELAELCNLHRIFLGRIEAGKTTVTMRNLYKIAATLNVSLAEFLAEERLAFPLPPLLRLDVRALTELTGQ
jgi:transcriptional regulator with XRE-family HTH domain